MYTHDIIMLIHEETDKTPDIDEQTGKKIITMDEWDKSGFDSAVLKNAVARLNVQRSLLMLLKTE